VLPWPVCFPYLPVFSGSAKRSWRRSKSKETQFAASKLCKVVHDSMLCISQVNQTDFKVTGVVETCDIATAPALAADAKSIVCPASFLWQPSRWAELFAAHSVLLALPAAGYYCAELCALFPAPAGYRIDQCQVVDIDECQIAADSGQVLCEQDATCMNRHSRSNADSAGFACVCRHGYYTVQLLPTLCIGQGFDVTFFVTETNSGSASNGSFGTAALSPVYLLRKVRQNVLASIQQRVVGIADTVPLALFAASSLLAEKSISYEATSAGTVWKLCVRIAATFVDMRVSTFRDAAIVVRTAMASNQSWPYGGSDAFQLHTQTVCSGGPENDRTDLHGPMLFDTCNSHADCAGTGRGMCAEEVAYLQVQTVETNSKSASVDSAASGFNLLAVRFDMASRNWQLDLEFEDHQPHTRRVLLLSKTRAVNGIRVFMPANKQLCTVSENATDMLLCLHGLSQDFHVLESMHAWNRNSSAPTWRDFAVFRDLATGSFAAPLATCTAGERHAVDTERQPGAPTAQLRRVVLSLGYDDVAQYIARSTQGTTALEVHFSVGIATLRDRNGRVSGAVTTRDILTKIGSSYVLSHDITSAQETDSMAPEVSVSMHVVSGPMLPKRSWGFVTFYIHLPSSATAAGITFDHDVIPIDSVTGSIAFFENGAVDTNPYPCIYNPDADSFHEFVRTFACSRPLLSVRPHLRVRVPCLCVALFAWID